MHDASDLWGKTNRETYGGPLGPARARRRPADRPRGGKARALRLRHQRPPARQRPDGPGGRLRPSGSRP
ncbi:MAG: hypothetical protein M0C28_00065 [Candidatus Moduliflexus flocculans]|nr:hypothetical protein [Candidatus Moduliflexus flocculans]